MKPSRFKLLFAYRNIKSNRKNSIVIMITLSLVFCLTMLLMSMKSTFINIYEYQALNKYNQIDIIVTYDEYSSSRLINKREVETDYDAYIKYSMSFFNLDVLTETVSQAYYSKMIAALPYEFEYLVDDDVLISDDEMIITKSYAKTYDLSIGDTVTFYILDQSFEYKIGDIFSDTGLFTGQTFYVNKEAIMESVYGFSFDNFGNALYIDVVDDVDIDMVVDLFEEDSSFNDYYIYPALNHEYINTRAMNLVSMMLGMGLIVLFAVVLVLDSLFPVVSRDTSQQQGVVNTLGGDKSFILHVNLIQWSMYCLGSFVVGALLTLAVNNYGFHVYGLKGFLSLKFMPLVYAWILVYGFVMLRALMLYYKAYKKSSISLIKNKRFEQINMKGIYTIVAFVLLLMEVYFTFFGVAWHALIVVVLSVYLTFNIASYLLIVLTNLLRNKKRKTVFSVLQLKNLKTNKHIHQSLRVLLISLMSVIIILSVRTFVYRQIDGFYEVMTFDLSLVNIHDYDDDLYNEISDDYEIDQMDEAAFYRDITIHIENERAIPCMFLISMDEEELDNYFSLNEYEIDTSLIHNDQAYILLPKSYKLVYNVKHGDTIKLDLNNVLKNVEVVVAGFLDIDIDQIVYTNIMNVELYKDLAIPNTLFMNTADKSNIYKSLIQAYSSDMYYVMNPTIYFEGMIDDIERITDFFTVITFFMVICFLVVVFNNTLLVFLELKNDYAKIKILGADKKIFIWSLFKELLLILFVVLTVGWLEVSVLSENLKYVVLFTNYYKDIGTSFTINIWGSFVVSVVLVLSYAFYMYNIDRIEIINEIKFY